MVRHAIMSRHLLRRRARERAAQMERVLGGDFSVRKAGRGPWRWYVIELREPDVR